MAPNGIVVGPVGKAYTPQVRRERERSFFSFSFFLFFSSFLLRRARASEKRRRRLTRSLFSPQIEIISLFFFPSPQGAVYAPVNNAYAPVRIDLTPPKPGDDTGDASGFNDNNGSKKRRAASRKLMGSPGASDDKEEEVVVKEGRAPHVDPFGGHLGGKLTISDDPLVRARFYCSFFCRVSFFSFFPQEFFFFLKRDNKFKKKKKKQDLSDEFPKDYRNWASVLSQVILKKEGSLETAAKVLQRVMLATHGHLSKVANGEEFFPRFHLQDPVLTADAGAAINGAVPGSGPLPPLPKVEGTMFSSSATFFNYAPCVLSESYQGVNGALTGLNFAPTLLSVRQGRGRGRSVEREGEKKIFFRRGDD